ncbi:hypothetical protein Pla111_08330 [Botrimarina hoheduenensis]|uniref:Uncharacterized protein n=1 Tax=Botrimarina hoheduenensis TaxID=2528000 RepID=A0A5C5WB30_9BACT|nr:hypothetical protein Pla111_08330 [Botrimarina hoheduenensis]
MKRTRHTTEQIIEKLRQADVALGKGAKSVGPSTTSRGRALPAEPVRRR